MLMDLTRYTRRYVSLTAAASGNQTFFTGEKKPMESVVFYRLSGKADCPFSLLFSDSIDSTFEDGSHSRAGEVLGLSLIHI